MLQLGNCLVWRWNGVAYADASLGEFQAYVRRNIAAINRAIRKAFRRPHPHARVLGDNF